MRKRASSRQQPLRILFPYMARWHAANRSRYSHLLSTIARKGHTVIILEPPSRRSEEIGWLDMPSPVEKHIDVRTVGIPSWLWNMRCPGDKLVKKALFTLWSVPIVRAMMRDDKADVLMLYNLPQYIYLVGSDVPLVFDYADEYIAMFEDEIRAGPHSPFVMIARWVLFRMFRRADAVTSVSAVLHDSFSHRRKVLLPNGAVPRPLKRARSLRVPREGRVFGFVGAFEYFIDLKLMLDLAALRPLDTFLLVGGGRRFREVHQDVHARRLTNVMLTGALPHEAAMEKVDTVDVCLNIFAPGRVSDAASPIKLFEYMARGKPILSTRTKEVHRIDPDEKIIYFADTLDEMQACIARMDRDAADRARRVQRGRNLVAKEYSWDLLADVFIDVCRKSVRDRADGSGRGTAKHQNDR